MIRQIIGSQSRKIIPSQSIYSRPLIYRTIHSSYPKFQQDVKPTKEAPPSTPAKPVEKKKTLWEKVKHEANHYWDGTKLLGLETKISFKLLLKSTAGYELTRREHKQLKRTTQDVVRLVPFAMFVLVPFAELLLPVALKLFPNMLPSTYESKLDKEKKMKRLRKTREVVSEVLRDTVRVKLPSYVTEDQKADFREFFRLVRSGTESPSREQLLRVARLFKDDIVLDNLQRAQLVAVSKYINTSPIGTNQMLRFRIRYKLLKIKQDDRAIDYEGIDSLSTVELQAACASRGIKVNGVPPHELKDDLSIWLHLRLREKIPSTLLILSNAYTYGDIESKESLYDALESVLSAIPDELYHEAEADVAKDDVTNKQRLELIKEQEELIKTETKQEDESGTIIQVKDKINLDDADKTQHLTPAQIEAKKVEAEKKN
ncbi:hypothetical protein WICANDRAFT_31866 [Wickerhamomyces anomalus NRRL Y-366-8]|uniref:Letm1 RBD domain-containing protein n=1 Tax=Wickerhamomyces anomalus (strain ATCC 58044 / CBS 1984 / NCYC 433 / NRRL Y-366-8) TaxID=683960 RepID=A0A1E3P295_WICAA|nr:uncharacterized protein WICANDRAFT_31866 [Wickerhamomyces anomalus NRRL Y-366-8]ODQ59324.1 hypothetical protein WICANDRAFT_31866 [Wickerhamomyces anomalus NRRL Y-366-8]